MHPADDSQERKREQELRPGEGEYRSLFEHSPVAIYLLDGEGKFLSANPAGARLLDSSAQEIVGTNIASTYVPGELPPAAQASGDQPRGLVSF